VVIWWWNTFKELQALESSSTPRSLVGSHTADSTEKDFGRSAMMKRTRFLGVDDMALVEEVVVAQLNISVYVSRSLSDLMTWQNTLLRKKLPEMLISSHLTTTIFWPERICFEIIEANRPRR
jgi:hypothetical protein